MKHIKVEEHDPYCNALEEKQEAEKMVKNGEVSEEDLKWGCFVFKLHPFCLSNKRHFLFYMNGEYSLISYPCCWDGYDHLGFKLSLLKSVSKFRKHQTFDISKSNKIGSDFRNLRKGHIKLGDSFQQLHYVYYDAAGQRYGITSTLKYSEALQIKMKQENDHDEMFEYLKTNGFEYMLNELRELQYYNEIHELSDVEIIRTMKQLSGSIRKQLKLKT